MKRNTKLKVYLLLRYMDDKARVIKTYLNKSDADKAKLRLERKSQIRTRLTYHVIEQDLIGSHNLATEMSFEINLVDKALVLPRGVRIEKLEFVG